MKPDILFCGDPHNRFEHINRLARERRPTAMVLLGDYELKQPLDAVLAEARQYTRIYWIPGNHDYDRESFYDNLFEHNGLRDHNLDGRVVNVGGVRIAGLGGIFGDKVWNPNKLDGKPRFHSRAEYQRQMGKGNGWRDGLPRRTRQYIWHEDYVRLSDQRADVLVTHEAPSHYVRGFAVLDKLACAMGAQLIVHGHHHKDYWCERDHSPSALGVGLAGIATLEGELLVPGLPNPSLSQLP